MAQQKKMRSCQRTNRLPISVQAAQHSFTWAGVMSNGIALHKMESIITIDTRKDGIAEHEMAQGRVKQFSVGSNESAPDEMARFLIKLYSTTSNGTAFREIA